MELRIVHTTGYAYDGLALASYNQARMTPQTGPGQIVVHTRLGVSPTPWTYDYRDYFGNEVTSFEVLDPHESMTVTAVSTVHTDRPPASLPALGWDDLAAPGVFDRWTEYLALPPLVAPPGDLAGRVREIAEGAGSPGEAAREVCALVHADVEYRPGSTDAATPAVDAWAQRGGVCQDMAHLVLGCLRTIGIPARYVSGYLHPDAEAAIGQTVVGESHAWVEWFAGDWRGYDPTNLSEVGELHVLVGRGRDYSDVSPLRGVYAGPGASELFVSVEITRVG